MEELTVINTKSKCHFCEREMNNDLLYGPKYKRGNIIAHYYCVLLSNRLVQNGSDDEGILGFLLTDIEKELQRTSQVLCIYCSRRKATIMCAFTKCRRTFHLPCGLKNGSSHEFLYNFKSYCHIHKLIQNIPLQIYKEACKTEIKCCICHEIVNVKDKHNSLWAPCCLKAWYHRNCVQKLAHSAGYFCRCAACNDSQKFNKWMQKHGIFIPQRDASWELVPNAFEELLFRYSQCDAKTCKCPDGRQRSEINTMWEIVVCDTCGSQGIHVRCGKLKFVNPTWECPECQKITVNVRPSSEVSSNSSNTDEGSSNQSKLVGVRQKKRRRGSEDFENYVLDKRKKRRTDKEEDEIEIDVVTVIEAKKGDETMAESVDNCVDVEKIRNVETGEAKAIQKTTRQNVLKYIKPGPLSYKLAEIRKVWGELLISEKKDVDKIDLIELSDHSEQEESDSDIEVMGEVIKKTPKVRFKSIPRNRMTKGRMVGKGGEKGSENFCKDLSKTQKMTPPLENFGIIAFMSFQTTKNPENCDCSLTREMAGEAIGVPSKEIENRIGIPVCKTFVRNTGF